MRLPCRARRKGLLSVPRYVIRRFRDRGYDDRSSLSCRASLPARDGWSRQASAAGQIFWTHTDSDHAQFNFSGIIGNSTAVAISTAYYPDNRTATNAVSKLGVQLAVDMASNILKEFWPDIDREVLRKHRAGTDDTR